MATPIRILVVDDEERFRSSIAQLLEADGHTVGTACDGTDALSRLEEREFDVILLDLKMPGLSGQETYEEILRRGYDVETVCLTGHAAMDEAIRLMQRGVFDYLLKPASVEDIIQAVKRAMEAKLLRQDAIDLNRIITGSASD